jgi:hypothetical protein
MPVLNAADENWELLRSFFPENWRELAHQSGALKGLRQDKDEENLLRVLLLHLGCGFSLRETVVRARQANLAELSDVALLKRLRKSKEWLASLCSALFREWGLATPQKPMHHLRLLDATLIKEPGSTGSLWRVHYSLRWPTLICDYFKLTAAEGVGTGESLIHYPLGKGEYVIVDRGYCHAAGIHYVARHEAFLTVRLNPQGIALRTASGTPFPLLEHLKTLRDTGEIGVWDITIPHGDQPVVSARLCAVRKSKAAIELAKKKLHRKASKNGSQLQPETLVYAEYVMVVTTFPTIDFPAKTILDWYRFRWQIELVFKRFKQIAELGHLPKRDEESAKAWVYGKLFVALLTEKIIQHASAVSPWGYELQGASA